MSKNIPVNRIARHAAPVVFAALVFAILSVPARAFATDACAPSSSIIYSPAQGTFGTVLFEDSRPQDGDLDFNDQFVAYSYQFLRDANGNVVTMKADFSVLAAGATYQNGLNLHLPLLRGERATPRCSTRTATPCSCSRRRPTSSSLSSTTHGRSSPRAAGADQHRCHGGGADDDLAQLHHHLRDRRCARYVAAAVRPLHRASSDPPGESTSPSSRAPPPR